jgi:hypothetical protein
VTPSWRKSSHSGGSQGGQSDCVEAARLTGAVGIRDSKNPGAGHIEIPADAFAALLARVKNNEL